MEKFIICRRAMNANNGFDYFKGFTADGLFCFTEKRECACLIPGPMVTTVLAWCELWDPDVYFFVMFSDFSV